MSAASSPSTTRRRRVVALLASMLLLASCGSASVTASSTTVEAAEKSGDTSDVTTTVAGEDDGTTTTTKAKDKSSGSGANTKFCQVALDAQNAMDDVFEMNDLEADPDEFLAEFQKGFQQVFDYLDSMVDTAPAELKSDVVLVRDAYKDAFGDVKNMTSLEELSDSDTDFLDSADVSEASERVEEYLTDVCGIDMDADG